MQKSEIGSLPCTRTHAQINVNWISDLNLRSKTIKPLEENIEENLDDTELGNNFLDITPKAEATKEKIDKLDFIKI